MAKRQSRKPTPKRIKKEGNIYDKLFKENIEKIFRPLIEKRLGVKIVKSTPLKEKMQTTIEVEMDFFYIFLYASYGFNSKKSVRIFTFIEQIKHFFNESVRIRA